MRGTLGGAVARLLVAGLLAGVLATNAGSGRLNAHAVGGLNSITVSPTHGKPTAPFAVTYSISPCVNAAGLTIAFSWNALPPAGQLLGTAATDSNCRATLSTTPPLNPGTHAGPVPGNYQVFGYVALPTGTPTPNTEVSTSYAVDVVPTPSPTAIASAKPSARVSASTTSAPSAAASTAGGPATSASGSAGSTDSSQPAAAVTTHASARPGWWTPGWVVVVGAIVVALLLAAALAMLAGWFIRRRRARAASGIGNDRAA
jgi:hypothetical protein